MHGRGLRTIPSPPIRVSAERIGSLVQPDEGIPVAEEQTHGFPQRGLLAFERDADIWLMGDEGTEPVGCLEQVDSMQFQIDEVADA